MEFHWTENQKSLPYIAHNSQQDNVNNKFTAKIESDDATHFLDVSIKQQTNECILGIIYRMLSCTGQYPNFHNFVLIKQKWGFAWYLEDRAWRICSQKL